MKKVLALIMLASFLISPPGQISAKPPVDKIVGCGDGGGGGGGASILIASSVQMVRYGQGKFRFYVTTFRISKSVCADFASAATRIKNHPTYSKLVNKGYILLQQGATDEVWWIMIGKRVR